MGILDAPTVTIAGHTITDQWDPTHPIVCDGIRFVWGRTNIYDENSATTLKLRLVDADGTLAGTSRLSGTGITVTRGDGRIIFRGRLTNHTIDRRTITDPISRQPRTVWLLELSASCKLAELAHAVLPGPGNVPAVVTNYGENYWATDEPPARVAAVMAAGANQIVSGIDWSTPFPAGPYYNACRPRKFADGWSVLDHIVSLYNMHPVSHVNYDPHANRTRIGQTAATSLLALKWLAGKLQLALTGGELVDAARVGVPSGYRTETTRGDGVDMVQIVQPTFGPSSNYEIVDHVVERQTSRFDPAQHGRNVHRVHSDMYYFPGTDPNTWQKNLADATRNIINILNDKLRLPTVRFDWRKFTYDASLAQLLIDTYDKPTPLYFYRSVFNPITDTGVTHQVLGGTLTWQQGGWQLDATLGPAAGTGTGITVDQICAHPDPTMADFDEGITLADLGNLTQGVAA